MTAICLQPHLQILDGAPMASSVQLARDFGVRHPRVMRLVAHAMRLVAGSAEERAFRSGSFTDRRGRTRPMAHLSRDGFGYVLTGLEGPRARECAAAYFRAFDCAASALDDARLRAIDTRALCAAAAQVHAAASAVLLHRQRVEWLIGGALESASAAARQVRH
jgi:Rha family phage regulatory protein